MPTIIDPNANKKIATIADIDAIANPGSTVLQNIKCATYSYAKDRVDVSGTYEDNQLVKKSDCKKKAPKYGGNTKLTLVSSIQNHMFDIEVAEVTAYPSGVKSYNITIPKGYWSMFASGIDDRLTGKYGISIGKVINSTDTSIMLNKECDIFYVGADRYAYF